MSHPEEDSGAEEFDKLVHPATQIGVGPTDAFNREAGLNFLAKRGPRIGSSTPQLNTAKDGKHPVPR